MVRPSTSSQRPGPAQAPNKVVVKERRRFVDLPANQKFKLNKLSVHHAPMEFLSYVEHYDPALAKPQTVLRRFPFESFSAFKRMLIIDANKSWKTHNIVFVDVKPAIVDFRSLSREVRRRVARMVTKASPLRISSVDSSLCVAPEEEFTETGDILKSVTPCQDLIENLKMTPPVFQGHAKISYYPFPVNMENLNAPALHFVVNKLKVLSKDFELTGTDPIRSLHTYSPTVDVYVQYYWNWTSFILNYFKPCMFKICNERYRNEDFFEFSPTFRNMHDDDLDFIRSLEDDHLNPLPVHMVDFGMPGTYKFSHIEGFTSADADELALKDRGEDVYLNTSAYAEVTQCSTTEANNRLAIQLNKCVNCYEVEAVPDPDPPINTVLPLSITEIRVISCPDCPDEKYFISNSRQQVKHYEYWHPHLRVQCKKCTPPQVTLKFPFEMEAHEKQHHTITEKKRLCDICGKTLFSSNHARHILVCRLKAAKAREKTSRSSVRRTPLENTQCMCEICSKTISTKNHARHIKICRSRPSRIFAATSSNAGVDSSNSSAGQAPAVGDASEKSSIHEQMEIESSEEVDVSDIPGGSSGILQAVEEQSNSSKMVDTWLDTVGSFTLTSGKSISRKLMHP